MPVKQYSVIPIGFSSERTTKTGKEMAAIYAIVRDKVKNEDKLTKIVLRGQFASLWRKVTFRARYPTVELTQYKGGDLGLDDRARFENPTGIIKESIIMGWLEKNGVRRITCAETLKYPSKKQKDTKYTDKLDWRIIRAVVKDCGVGKRDDKTEFGYYHVGDYSVRNNDAPFGIMTVWCPSELVLYDGGSECDFIGTIDLDDPEKPVMSTMTCYMVVPVNVIPFEGKGQD